MGALDWASLVVSVIFLAGGVVVDVLAWMGKLGEGEPPLVLHLSTAAIIGSGISGVIATLAAVRAA